MTIPPEILEELANGQRNALEVHPNNSGAYRPMIRPDVDGLVKALKSNPNIESIDLSHMSVGNDWLIEIAHALRGNTTLKSLNISLNQMGDDAAAAFSAVLMKHPKLESINCAGNSLLTEVGSGQIAHALSTCPNLKEINFSSNALGIGGAAAIGRMMRKSPKFEKLNIALCGVDKDPAKAAHIASAVPFCPNLITLHVADSGVPQHQQVADACAGLVDTNTNPNLFMVSPNGSHLSKLINTNTKNAEALFQPIQNGDGELENMKTVDLARIEPVLPILANIRYRANIAVDGVKHATANAYLQATPELDEAAISRETLLAKDDKGFTPLDHPRTWQKIDTIAAALEQSGTPFNQDFLQGKNSRGETWLECGLASAPDKLIPTLNAHGMHLRAADLLSRDASGNDAPKAVYEAVLASGKVESLFTLDNLKDASQSELLRLFKAVPEDSQPRIKNFSTLRQQVRTEASAKQGIGR